MAVSGINFGNLASQRDSLDVKGTKRLLDDATRRTGNAQVIERIFVGVFLPILANHLTGTTYECPNGGDIDLWVHTASGGDADTDLSGTFKEVDVVEYIGGPVLFTVPPLYDREAIKPSDIKARFGVLGGVGHLVKTAQQLMNQSPKNAEAYLDSRLHSHFNVMKGDGPAVEYLKRWGAIFKKYNLVTPVDLEKIGSPEEATEEVKPAPLLDYTEFDEL
jgi:hypothetical protein